MLKFLRIVNPNEKPTSIKVKKFHERAKIPTRAHETDAGYDLYALEDYFIEVGATQVVKTGVGFEVPSGYFAKIFDRSSVASRGVVTSAGVCDSGYTGEYKIVMHNFSNQTGYNSRTMTSGFRINAGDKIAQVVILKCETPPLEEVDSFTPSDRGEGGFGSSDAKN